MVAAMRTASWTCSSVSPPASTTSSCDRMHTSQPLMALTASEYSSKSALLVAGLTSRFIRSRAGSWP